MILSWDSLTVRETADDPGTTMRAKMWRATIVDIDTGEPVHRVIWYDTETHELERVACDEKNNPLVDHEKKEVQRIKERRRLKITPANHA